MCAPIEKFVLWISIVGVQIQMYLVQVQMFWSAELAERFFFFSP